MMGLMHRYQFDLSTALRFRELIEEYGRLYRLEGMTPQVRGQRFNEFVAGLLCCWGLDRVQANVRSVGEIDVAFALDGTRVLLEAKWEQAPVSIDPIAKLSRRITQRLAGTRGVFLSMSGYSSDVLKEIVTGTQPDTLLLDRTHLEAMLSGLLSPHDLLTELVDRAAYRGELYVPLGDLIVPDKVGELPGLAPGAPGDHLFPIVAEIAAGVTADVVLSGTPGHATTVDGLAIGADGQLLLTTQNGIVQADIATGALNWAVPIPGCRSRALALDDGSLLVLHGATVLRWSKHDVQIISGGYTGGSSLLWGSNGEVWVFDYKGAGWLQHGLVVTLTRLGQELGQEERHVIDFQAGIWSAVWLSGRRFFLAGDGHFGVVDLDVTPVVEIEDRLRSPHPNQRGAIRIDDRTVLTTSRHGTIYRIDVNTGQSTLIARFDVPPYSSDLVAAGPGQAYVLHHLIRGQSAYYPVVIRSAGYAAP